MSLSNQSNMYTYQVAKVPKNLALIDKQRQQCRSYLSVVSWNGSIERPLLKRTPDKLMAESVSEPPKS